MKTRPTFLVLLSFFAATSFGSVAARAAADTVIYDDALASGWQNWSWAAVDLAHTTTVHEGVNAIAVTPTAWSALYLRSAAAPVDTMGFQNLTFWAHGGELGGQALQVAAIVNDAALPGVAIAPLAAGTWQKITVPLGALGAESTPDFDGFWIQDRSGADQPTFYVDDVMLESGTPPTPPPPLVGMALYDDRFIWQNWSWAPVDAANTAVVSTGSAAIAVNATPFSAVFFHHSPFSTEGYSNLTFWIHGGETGGQTLIISALLNEQPQTPVPLGPLVAGEWQQVSISLADLGVADQDGLTGFWFQESAGLDQPTFYLDDVRLDFAPPPELVQVAVDARQKIRRVDPRIFGMNTAIWDPVFNTATTAELLAEVDNQALRFPGGSISDLYHWETNTTEGQNFQWATNFDDFAAIASVTDAQVFITVNYGTGTPEEAARWVEYANITQGLGFKYWEVGNENYGTWEADNNDRPHDPVTYATRFQEYYRQMKAVDPTIKIGAVITGDEDSNANYPDQSVINPRTGAMHSGWTAVLLDAFNRLGVTPDFVIYHRYEQAPFEESDAYLLTSSRTWQDDAVRIRQMLQDYLGQAARRVEINCTEHNSVFSQPGKQTTSLVNGLFFADTIGNILHTEFNAMLWWDLRNGQEVNNTSASLYGWRRYGDYGIVNAADPAGPADRYPTFYVYKLLQHFARGGETVIPATSDYIRLGAHAVRTGNEVHLLLINKHPVESVDVRISLTGWKPKGKTTVYSYGIPQDEAARTGEGSADVQETEITLSGSPFTFTTAPYSATVIHLTPGNGHGRDSDRD